MDVATVSANGQVTVPVDVRRRLGLSPGDKLMFLENAAGDTVVVRPEAAALLELSVIRMRRSEAGSAAFEVAARLAG